MKSAEDFFRGRVLEPILAQLRQGITPEKISMTIALGAALGVFPILGSTTALCFLAGLAFKLNQPVIQIVNYLIYPLQIILIPVFVRMGETVFGAEPLSFSVLELKDEFMRSPQGFMRQFGLAGVHAVTAWSLAAPVFIAALHLALLPVLRKIPMPAEKK